MNSSAVILTRFNPIAMPVDSTQAIKLKLDVDLRNQLKHLDLQIINSDNNTPSIKAIAVEYHRLCELAKSHQHKNDLFHLEKYKQVIMQSVFAYIRTIMPVKKRIIKPKVYKSALRRCANYLLFGVLLVGGVALDAILNYIAAVSVIAFVPFIGPALIMAASVAIAAFNAFIFLAFDAKLMGAALGIIFSKTIHKVYDLYDSQVKLAKKINHALLRCQAGHDPMLPDLNALKKLVVVFNEDLLDKSTSIKPYHEKPLRKIARYIVTAVGLITEVGGGYFISLSFISLISAGLIGTPLGWAIVGVCSAVALGYYMFTRAMSIYSFINPLAGPIKHTRKQLVDFVNNDILSANDLGIDNQPDVASRRQRSYSESDCGNSIRRRLFPASNNPPRIDLQTVTADSLRSDYSPATILQR